MTAAIRARIKARTTVFRLGLDLDARRRRLHTVMTTPLVQGRPAMASLNVGNHYRETPMFSVMTPGFDHPLPVNWRMEQLLTTHTRFRGPVPRHGVVDSRSPTRRGGFGTFCRLTGLSG